MQFSQIFSIFKLSPLSQGRETLSQITDFFPIIVSGPWIFTLFQSVTFSLMTTLHATVECIQRLEPFQTVVPSSISHHSLIRQLSQIEALIHI